MTTANRAKGFAFGRRSEAVAGAARKPIKVIKGWQDAVMHASLATSRTSAPNK
jgi:hypothetical protein